MVENTQVLIFPMNFHKKAPEYDVSLRFFFNIRVFALNIIEYFAVIEKYKFTQININKTIQIVEEKKRQKRKQTL